MAELKYLTVEHLSTKDIIRIFSKISVDPVTGCWNWIASIGTRGYGQLRLHGHSNTAHRVLYAWLVSPVPIGRGRGIPILDHLCENKSCCNPVHLTLTSHSLNILRGSGITAAHARKSHCVNGHRLPDEKVQWKTPRRLCKICKNIKRRARRARAKSIHPSDRMNK